jgi:hypothetical protein
MEDTLISIGKKLEGRGEELSPARTSHNYAPTIIAREREAKGMKKDELAAAFSRLLDAGKVQVETLRGGSDESTIQVQLNTLGGQIYLVPLSVLAARNLLFALSNWRPAVEAVHKTTAPKEPKPQ